MKDSFIAITKTIKKNYIILLISVFLGLTVGFFNNFHSVYKIEFLATSQINPKYLVNIVNSINKNLKTNPPKVCEELTGISIENQQYIKSIEVNELIENEPNFESSILITLYLTNNIIFDTILNEVINSITNNKYIIETSEVEKDLLDSLIYDLETAKYSQAIIQNKNNTIIFNENKSIYNELYEAKKKRLKTEENITIVSKVYEITKPQNNLFFALIKYGILFFIVTLVTIQLFKLKVDN